MKINDDILIKDCQQRGILIDEHTVEANEHVIKMSVYTLDHDIYVHVTVDDETLGFKPVDIEDHTFEFK